MAVEKRRHQRPRQLLLFRRPRRPMRRDPLAEVLEEYADDAPRDLPWEDPESRDRD